MKASGLDLCIWHFYVDRAKTKNLAEIGEKPPKSCYFMLLSPPRCYILGAICPYHLKANEWSCASDIYWRTAPNIWQKLAKKPPKSGFSSAPISFKTFYSTELNVVPADSTRAAIVHLPFSGGPPHNFGGNWQKPKTNFFSFFFRIFLMGQFLSYESFWSGVVHLTFSGWSRQ